MKKNSALFRRYSAAIAAHGTCRDDIVGFCAMCAIAAIARYRAAKWLLLTVRWLAQN